MKLYWDEPVELELDGCNIMLAPWMCNDNWEKSIEAFKNTKAQVLMGHFQIMGFEMDKGHICTDGMDKTIFDKFDVYLGSSSSKLIGNITYLGAQYEMTWADYDQKRGFSVFDTQTREMEYVQNPLHIFHKIWYDDTEMTIEDVANLDTSQLSDTYIKVIVTNKETVRLIYPDGLTLTGATDIKVVGRI